MSISISPSVARSRSRLGVASRLGSSDDIAEARRDLAAAKLADYIKRTVASAPPLTADQRAKLAHLLTAGGEAS